MEYVGPFWSTLDFIERTYCTDIVQSYCMVVSEIWVDTGLFGGYSATIKDKDTIVFKFKDGTEING